MKTLFYSVLFVSLLFSCGKKDDPTPAPSDGPNVTFPFLRDNYQWKYDYDILGTTGTFTMLTDSLSPNLYKLRNTFDTDSPYLTYWFVSGPYLKTYEEGESQSDAVIIYKSNPSLNDSWSHTDASNNHTTTYKVVDTDVTVYTSAGTFDHCKKIKVSFNYAFNTQFNYWHESYGLVYQTGYFSLDLTEKNFRQANTEYGYSRW